MAGLRTQPPLLTDYAIGAPLVHAGMALGLTLPFNILLGYRSTSAWLSE
jgi:hypothetical protein